MRGLIRAAAATAAALLLVGCGGAGANPPAPASSHPACAGASKPHRAYVVVQHLDGHSLVRCVGFAADRISGDELMKGSGLVYAAQRFSFGDAICAIDGEPKGYDTCLPTGAPYWALWISSGVRSYRQAELGYTQVKLGPGEALGWRYTSPTESNPLPPPPPPES